MSFSKTALLVSALATASLLAPTATAATPTQALTAHASVARRPHASLALSASRSTGWVGQAIPVTVTAVFRAVEGVTIEGSPTLTSKAVMTSDVAKEPRQSTEIIDGERVLVARWSATVTPSSAGTLDLHVELPVDIKFREAPAHTAAPGPPDDPFDGFGTGDETFDAIFDRMRKQMMQATVEDLGTVHTETVALKASSAPLEVHAIPTAGQPATFTGAVGAFDIDATLSSATAAVSEPITLRITVRGDVDPDRVDLPGVTSSSVWKAYPPHALPPAAPATGAVHAKTPQKIFEQTLVPLEGGVLTVPPISFTSFDPASGAYITHATRPLEVSVSGTAPPAAAVATSVSTPPVGAASLPSPSTDTHRSRVAVAIAGLAAVLLALALGTRRLILRRRPAWRLRRSMRRAAAAGDVAPFVASARTLVAARLAERWSIAPSDVTPAIVRKRLGPDGEPLAEVLIADAALRFGRGGLEGLDLEALSHAVEHSLRATKGGTFLARDSS